MEVFIYGPLCGGFKESISGSLTFQETTPTGQHRLVHYPLLTMCEHNSQHKAGLSYMEAQYSQYHCTSGGEEVFAKVETSGITLETHFKTD